MLRQLIFAQVQGQPLELHEDPIRTWLGLPVDITAEQAMDALVRSQARVLGTAACPECGARVQDKEGLEDEACPWCGASLATGG